LVGTVLTKSRNFIPDSGKLLHLRNPPLSENVRIDAGFVAGDDVSAHYDPMIAKLIVRAETREAALQKLRLALESYEIGGPVTNVEFLKRLCVSPAFIAGEVETGYIQKYADELFSVETIPNEAYAQVAIGLLLREKESLKDSMEALMPSLLGPTFQSRSYSLTELPSDGKRKVEPVTVQLRQISNSQIEATVRERTYIVSTSPTGLSSTYSSFFPHTRIESTLIEDGDRLTLWQLGHQYRFIISPPAFLEKALGITATKNSVLAPMPCKVLRVEVSEGEDVKKDQILAVIESMKMETTIRSPVDGKIKRVVHVAGDMCKAGTALVEFEE
jgi:3-methylcrotonyl-CoA carboxylase alpha subunit